jgi:hypothetical protein
MSEEINALQADGARVLSGEPQRFPDDVCAREVFLGYGTVGFEYQGDRLAEVLPGLLERGPLGIGSRKFLNERDKAFGDFTIHSGQLDGHRLLLDGSTLECTTEAVSAQVARAATSGVHQDSRSKATDVAEGLDISRSRWRRLAGRCLTWTRQLLIPAVIGRVLPFLRYAVAT